MRFLSVPEGIRQAAGQGLSESLLLLPRKIHAKQKEQHSIRCCSWCSKAIQIQTIFYNGLNGKISEQHLILFVNQIPTDLWFSP